MTCHIFSVSDDGPRGRAGLTEKQLNSVDNLILLCRDHHSIIDGQHESYPASLLTKWKRDHEAKMTQLNVSERINEMRSERRSTVYQVALVDGKIQEAIVRLQRSRHYTEFNSVEEARRLANRLTVGEFKDGSATMRIEGLASCARELSSSDLASAEHLLEEAKILGGGSAVDLAEALVDAERGDHRRALGKLAELDSPSTRTIALILLAHHQGKRAAAEWFRKAGLSTTDLDSEGLFVLLTLELDLANWESAVDIARRVTSDDMLTVPPLAHQVGIALLVNSIPADYRGVVCGQFPLDPARFPFNSDEEAVQERRTARRHFSNAMTAANELGLTAAAKIDETYKLWLGLNDIDSHDDTKTQLEERFRDAESALHLVPLGIGFEVRMDLPAVVREIERQESVRGGITSDSANARLALASTREYSEQSTEYIIDHFDELSEYLNPKFMRVIQFEWLLKRGQYDEATECVKQLERDGIPDVDRFRERINETKGADLVAVRVARFENGDRLDDLLTLAEYLLGKEDWDRLCKYGSILYERTRSVIHAEWMISALANSNKMDEVRVFLRSHPDLVSQSRGLQMADAWSSYCDGELVNARVRLESLRTASEDRNCRLLKVRVAIALGDWHSLTDYVAKEFENRDCRNAEELLGAAQLGYSVGSPHARVLLDAAIDEGNDNAEVLASAYYLAVQEDLESDVSVEVLQRSAALSQEHGPVRKMDLRGVAHLHTQLESRNHQVWRLYRDGSLPMCIAAQLQNMSLLHMTIIAAFQNLDEADIRRRRVIPAYSGRRVPRYMELAGSVAMDSTTLLTLSFLDVLDTALAAFDSVWIPHCTMGWLFQERQRVAFHQPRRVREAREILDLLARDRLGRFVSTVATDPDLVSEIGEELASLIAEAEFHHNFDHNNQHVVVRSAPVYLNSSLLEVELDLTAHTHVLTSCVAVVNKLQESGCLTATDDRIARSYLSQHEKEWPNQPEISDRAVVYLDDLATQYFLHLGLLDKLSACGLNAVVSSSTLRQANELMVYDSISEKALEVIERIRHTIERGIISGKVKVGRSDTTDDSEQVSVSAHPTTAVTKLATDCNAIIVDDRFVNKHESIQTETGRATPVFTTLDLLSTLQSNKLISSEVFSDHVTKLRRAGYAFVNITTAELTEQLVTASVKSGRLLETAVLKAVRESLLSTRMSDFLQLPQDETWLQNTMETLRNSLNSLWASTSDITNVPIRSDWLFRQLDIRGWTQAFTEDKQDFVTSHGPILSCFKMLSSPGRTNEEVKSRYWRWLEERALRPMKEREPELYDLFLEVYRRYFTDVVDATVAPEH